MEVETKAAPLEPEIVTREETALAARAEHSVLEHLMLLENGVAIIERRTELMETMRVAAIKRTAPSDWVLGKDAQGVETAMLTASGARKVAEVYGVELEPIPPRTTLEPEKITHAGGRYSYRIHCRARSRVNGQEVEIEAERRSDEDFTGRNVDEGGALTFRGGTALDADLRSSTYQRATTKAARILGNMIRLAKAELDSAWQGTSKSTAACRFGHGYGTSQDRKSQGVTEGDVKERAKTLGEEILRRVSGDTDTARSVLRDITANKEGKYAKESVAQFTKADQVDWAWEKLRKHPVFGDHSQTRETEE